MCARNHVWSTSSTLKWILTRPDTICIPNDTPGRPQKRAENLSYGTLSGQRYTLQSPKLSGGLWAFSAPGVFEATHSRFWASLCRKDDGKEGISSVELAHAGRRESLLALPHPEIVLRWYLKALRAIEHEWNFDLRSPGFLLRKSCKPYSNLANFPCQPISHWYFFSN